MHYWYQHATCVLGSIGVSQWDIALVYLKKDEFLLALDSFEKAKNIRVGALEAQNGTNIPKDKLKNAYAILCNLYSYIGMLNEWKGHHS